MPKRKLPDSFPLPIRDVCIKRRQQYPIVKATDALLRSYTLLNLPEELFEKIIGYLRPDDVMRLMKTARPFYNDLRVYKTYWDRWYKRLYFDEVPTAISIHTVSRCSELKSSFMQWVAKNRPRSTFSTFGECQAQHPNAWKRLKQIAWSKGACKNPLHYNCRESMPTTKEPPEDSFSAVVNKLVKLNRADMETTRPQAKLINDAKKDFEHAQDKLTYYQILFEKASRELELQKAKKENWEFKFNNKLAFLKWDTLIIDSEPTDNQQPGPSWIS